MSRLCDQESISLKVTNNRLVLFDDRKYEAMKPIRVITRGESDVKSYSFDRVLIGAAYASSELTYFDSGSNRTIKGSFQIPGASGPVLKLNERVTSEAEAIRKAKNALREQNKQAQQARFTVVGDYALAQGLTVELSGYGAFDDKYIITTARHTVGDNGYETMIDLRKVLSY